MKVQNKMRVILLQVPLIQIAPKEASLRISTWGEVLLSGLKKVQMPTSVMTLLQCSIADVCAICTALACRLKNVTVEAPPGPGLSLRLI